MVYKRGKKAQTTLFIIIAILVVVIIGVFFLLQDGFDSDGDMPAEFQPVYNTLLSCVEQDTKTGVNILESQGGYIYLPEFEPGSEYMPFSSQLDFLGNPIPYWYYVSGNNIQKTQVPSMNDMEADLERYIEENVKDCDFSSYYEQGYEIEKGQPKADVLIKDNKVEVKLNMDLGILSKDDAVFAKEHGVEIDSSLGKLYKSAREVYQTEQQTMFLENYAVDTLRLYAPVDGVEMTCSPKTWNANDVFNELEEAIEQNTLALRNENGEYELSEKENNYFTVDLGINENVRFLNSRNWTNSFDVSPTEENSPLMIANPVGNQPGMEMMGFCYVPYHFVYDVKYPVLIQVFEKGSAGETGEEIFQFPFAVVLQGNKPREPQEGSEAVAGKDPEICQHKNTLIEVNTYDTTMNPIEANISFRCFGSNCNIGETSLGTLKTSFPQCYNGVIIARAEGYKTAEYVFSTIDPRSVDIILDKTYERDIDLRLDGSRYNGNAIISFTSEEGSSKSVVYPENKKIELSEGQYTIEAYVYRNSSIKLEEKTYEECFDVPRSGVGGIVGMTEEKCVDVQIPSQTISRVLSGGGSQSHYILESQLEDSEFIVIDGNKLDTPETLEDLQETYNKFENSGLDISFR